MNETSTVSGIDTNTSTHQHPNTKKLVLFDFDGTITTRDTLLEFIRFYHGKKKMWAGILALSPVLALYALKLIPNWKAKQVMLIHFFKGERLRDFDSRCVLFSTTVLPSLIRPRAMEAIESYRAQNATLAVVSASAENWVKPWCDQYGLIPLCTKLEVHHGTLTGKLLGRNCYGDEKVCRIRDTFNLSNFDEIIAYGDSRGDKEMLALATPSRSFFRPFRPGP